MSTTFHPNHGRRVTLSEDARTCHRQRIGLGSKWVYSLRDIKENEIISVRISKLSPKSGKKPFTIGFTDDNPHSMPRKPKANIHMCNIPFVLATEDCKEGSMVILTYDLTQRLVFLGIDGHLKGVHELWGLSDTPRWLALRLGGHVKEVEMHASPDGQWGALIIETTRIAKAFKDTSYFNHGATGIQKPQLTFQHTGDPRVAYEDDDRVATIQGATPNGIVMYTSRPVLLSELVALKFSRVCYGTTVEITPISNDPMTQKPGEGHGIPIVCRLSQDELLHFVCNENGILIQGKRSYVQSSTRFFPVEPVWLRFKISTPATFLKIEFEDPHRLPPKSSLKANGRLVVKDRAFSSTKHEHTTLCKICYEKQMDTVLAPCHHLSMCGGCTRKVLDKIDWKCPSCDEEVTGVFMVKLV